MDRPELAAGLRSGSARSSPRRWCGGGSRRSSGAGRTRRARRSAGALAAYNAPVGSAAPADAKVKFATDAERLAAAEKAFESVKSRYRFTPQAKLAELFLARIAADRGDAPQAIRLLGEIASSRSSDPVVRLAMLDLIRLRVARGEGLQLVSELEAMAAGKDPRLPRDAALFHLAEIWQHEGKPEEAAKLYRKLVEDFPDSPVPRGRPAAPCVRGLAPETRGAPGVRAEARAAADRPGAPGFGGAG